MKRVANLLGILNSREPGYALLCAITAIALPAQTYTTLHNFDYTTDGAWPDGGLVQAGDGYLYGTTFGGGNLDGGTIFAIKPKGALKTIYQFCTPDRVCPQNVGPLAPLIRATNGELYGTTYGELASWGVPGAVFKVTSGEVETMHSFCVQSGCPDGYNPLGLVQAANRSLYGTTEFGGSGTIGYSGLCATGYDAEGCGTIFEITLAGTFTKLYTFCAAGGMCRDGAGPNGGLVQGADGNLYGSTRGGGVNDAGTVFKITPSGTLTTLHLFCTQRGCPDGLTPGELIQTSSPDLYGTTYLGGTGGVGTIFKITQSGALTTVYSFCREAGACPDGANPAAWLIAASDGNLYGSTAAGGPTGQGTIFKLNASGTLTTIYGGGATTLMQDTNGDLYGTTGAGGSYGYGTVFRLAVGLPAFVRTLPGSGQAGATVKLLGTDLSGATSVSFGGTAAVFEVVSNSEIDTAVPVGATSGAVYVVTPGGTLLSNVSFFVRP